jgi:hypothetical protein
MAIFSWLIVSKMFLARNLKKSDNFFSRKKEKSRENLAHAAEASFFNSSSPLRVDVRPLG